uniref:Putative mannose-1-phosphate guanylyltransferase n=1 Tax=Magnetococcus massalia (strain MO-1) TaxID=451514 RepID=A0A1S7LL41_MAGMO|nr:Putative mannose-1-phosphate guanylyltransferase [Candidatus Magnetococcus massalia]
MTSFESWRSVCVQPETSLKEALRTIDAGALKIALVTDDELTLLGVVTDGDIRRGLLKEVGLDAPVERVMQKRPVTANDHDSRDKLISIMINRGLEHIPILNGKGELVGLSLLHELVQPIKKSNWVVIMAGGLGSRLGELTQNCPKPLLKVGDKPILEIIIERFVSHGFYNFYLSINYKKEMIKSYFGDGSQWGVEIRYLEESKRLGTAGPLALIEEVPKDPFFVINADLLTKLDFTELLDFHTQSRAVATLGARQVEHTFPYGVVLSENDQLVDFTEKPTHTYKVNAGIYLLEPRVLDVVEKNCFLDMPELLQKLHFKKNRVSVFSFIDYWLDIGLKEDFYRANREHEELFLE